MTRIQPASSSSTAHSSSRTFITVIFPFLAAFFFLPVLSIAAGVESDASSGQAPITAQEALKIVERSPDAPPSRLLGKRLPKSADLRKELPPVGQQGDGYTQACVTFATVYYQMSQMVKHFLHPSWDLKNPQYQFSVDFAFSMGGFGRADSVYKVLSQYGCVDMAERQYNVRNLSVDPTANQFEAAKPYRIGGYAALWNHGATTAEYDVFPFDNPIRNAKAWLADGFVLSATIGPSDPTFPDGHCNPPAFFFDPPNVTRDNSSGHGVAIVGYNDNINPRGKGPDHKGGFLMVNSEGPNWNGDMHGYLWLSYDYVKRFVPDCWIMVPGASDAPVITGCEVLASGTLGWYVTIHGQNFGSYRRLAQVTFNGIAASETRSWTNDTIIVRTESNCPPVGPAMVYNWDGVAGEPYEFQ